MYLSELAKKLDMSPKVGQYFAPISRSVTNSGTELSVHYKSFNLSLQIVTLSYMHSGRKITDLATSVKPPTPNPHLTLGLDNLQFPQKVENHVELPSY